MITNPELNLGDPATDFASRAEVRGAEVSAILIPMDLWLAVCRHLQQALPCEGVGLLSVNVCGTEFMADRFYPGQNADQSQSRYTMDSGNVRSALRDMQRRGTQLGAIIHSHPRTAPVPSAGDLAEATLPGVLSIIVGFKRGIETRAWALAFDSDGRAYVAHEVLVLLDAGGARFISARRHLQRESVSHQVCGERGID